MITHTYKYAGTPFNDPDGPALEFSITVPESVGDDPDFERIITDLLVGLSDMHMAAGGQGLAFKQVQADDVVENPSPTGGKSTT